MWNGTFVTPEKDFWTDLINKLKRKIREWNVDFAFKQFRTNILTNLLNEFGWIILLEVRIYRLFKTITSSIKEKVCEID